MLWAMTNNSGFVISSDGGQNWEPRGTGLPFIYSENLAVHPLYLDLMFTGVHDEGSIGGQGLYKSIDGGQTWARKDAGLEPNAEIADVVVDPTNTDIAYCADYLSGVYGTLNGGESWFPINDGLDHRTINVLAITSDGSVLYAGIEGAGVYRLGTVQESGINQSQMDKSFRLYSNYPNPFSKETTIRYDILKPNKVKIDIINLQGQLIKTLINDIHSPGAYEFKWNGTNNLDNEVANGIYFYRMICDKHILMQKMVIMN